MGQVGAVAHVSYLNNRICADVPHKDCRYIRCINARGTTSSPTVMQVMTGRHISSSFHIDHSDDGVSALLAYSGDHYMMIDVTKLQRAIMFAFREEH